MLFDNYMDIMDENFGINIYDMDGNSIDIESIEMSVDYNKEFWKQVSNR